MIIVEIKDLICDPNTGIELANLVGGEVHKLLNSCGHLCFAHKTYLYSELIREFFNK